MHGLIFAELKKFVVANLGAEAWNRLLKEASLEGRTYLPNKVYPDEEVGALVAAASKVTGKPAQGLLESFGEFIAPDLVQLYKEQINPRWKTLDLIEHTEETIHRVVRLRDPSASPPRLVAERPSPDLVVIKYTSARRLCAVARGIVKGLGTYYKEPVLVEDETCMLRGDPTCRILVRRSA